MSLFNKIFGKTGKDKPPTPQEAIQRIRDVEELLGKKTQFLEKKIEDELQNNEYVANHPEEGKIRKQVTYFLASAPMNDLKLGDSGGLDDAKWFKLQDIQTLNFYNDIYRSCFISKQH